MGKIDAIIIDAGHGGVDSGAVNGNNLEKDLNLEISKYMYDEFKKYGIPVYLTRDKDLTLNQKDRIKKILSFGNSENTILISNHLNAGGGEGAEVIYSIRNNSKLADMILNNLTELGLKRRKVYQRRLPSDNSKDYYYVLRNSGKDESIIVEYGFIDNDKDLDIIKNNYKELVDAVVKAVLEYKGIKYIDSNKEVDKYMVIKGDTLYSIAKKLDTSVSALKKINNLDSDSLYIGQILNIPDNNIYIVEKGDTLYSIAKKYGISVDRLKEENNLSSNMLSIGDKLNIPDKDNIYVVKKGDTLYSISNKYGISINKLKELNNLDSNELSIGQIIMLN